MLVSPCTIILILDSWLKNPRWFEGRVNIYFMTHSALEFSYNNCLLYQQLSQVDPTTKTITGPHWEFMETTASRILPCGIYMNENLCQNTFITYRYCLFFRKGYTLFQSVMIDQYLRIRYNLLLHIVNRDSGYIFTVKYVLVVTENTTILRPGGTQLSAYICSGFSQLNLCDICTD